MHQIKYNCTKQDPGRHSRNTIKRQRVIAAGFVRQISCDLAAYKSASDLDHYDRSQYLAVFPHTEIVRHEALQQHKCAAVTESEGNDK